MKHIEDQLIFMGKSIRPYQKWKIHPCEEAREEIISLIKEKMGEDIEDKYNVNIGGIEIYLIEKV